MPKVPKPPPLPPLNLSAATVPEVVVTSSSPNGASDTPSSGRREVSDTTQETSFRVGSAPTDISIISTRGRSTSVAVSTCAQQSSSLIEDEDDDDETSGLNTKGSKGPPNVLRRVYNRIRIAALLSNSKRSQAGFEAEPDSDAIVGDIHLKEVVRTSRQNSAVDKSSVKTSDYSSRKDRKSSLKRRPSPSKVSSSFIQSQSGDNTMQPVPSQVSFGGMGCGGGQSNPNTTSTTRNYTLGKGSIHFWRSNAFDPDGKPFLKVNHDVNVDDVASIMHGNWKMKPPRIVTLVISNVSGLKEWGNLRQRLNFQKGLLKAARTTNMWIFTNGTNIGASKVIGDAIYTEKKEKQSYHCHASHIQSGNFVSLPEHKPEEPDLNVIGVVREDLIRCAEQLTEGSVNIENLGNTPEEGKYDLNPDHTHFIVIRDNTVNKTGINLFTSRVMQFLSTIGGGLNEERLGCSLQPGDNTRDVTDLCSLVNMEIPVVSIVIQGGYECARLVLDCLKRQFPVVVLRGSGGLADLLAYAYVELKQRARDYGPWGSWDPEFVESYLKPELSSKIAHHFPKLRENILTRNLFRDRILECVRLAKQNGLSFLTVLNMHNYSECKLENLSVYLLRALFKSKPRSGSYNFDTSRAASSNIDPGFVSDERLLKELYLTLDWNCPDVARDEVLIRDPSYCVRLQKDLFMAALLRPQREEFVDLFMSLGFRLHTFITPKRLMRLFKQIFDEEFFRSVCWEGVLAHSLDSTPSKYFLDTDLNWLIETCTGQDNFVNSDHLYFNVVGMYVHDVASAERKALSILALWSVFANRTKLVETLWKHSDQPIHLALVISMAFDRLSWHVSDSTLKNDLKEKSKKFSERATGVLDSCYNEATCRAFDVLSEEGPDWNYKTAVDIAANARNRSFLAHPCCQKWLTNTFLGNIKLRELSWGFFTIPAFVKILLSAFFIFPMFIWVRFKWPKGRITLSDKKNEKDEEDELDLPGIPGDETNLLAESNDPITVNGGHSLFVNQGVNNNNCSSPAGKSERAKSLRPDFYTSLLRDREVIIRSQPPLYMMIYYMWTAPITKFWTFHLFYILYLALFSWAVLWPSCGNQYLDAAVCSWTGLIVIEYVRRTYILYKKYTSVPLVFKCIEILLIISFVVVYATASIWNVEVYEPYTRKVILCVALLYFYYRLIAIYLPISPTLGPLLYRLKLMVLVDFTNFMRMALVLIISSGVVMQATMFPDAELSASNLHAAWDRAFMALFTLRQPAKVEGCELLRATHSSDSCFAGTYNTSRSSIQCPTTGVSSYVFAIQYFILLKLIMITLLYAMFSARASKMADEVDAIWKYQRYILVVDFANRLPLPSPLSLFCYLYYLLKWLYRTISCYYTIKCFKAYFKRSHGAGDVVDGKKDGDSKYNMRMSEEDFNFWRHLAKEYSRKLQIESEEKDLSKKQFESIQSICEEIEYEKRVLRQLKGRISEIERMVLTSHTHLENIQHLAAIRGQTMTSYPDGDPKQQTSSQKSHPLSTIIRSFASSKVSNHILSRQSPYPGTRVQRIPVPDKFVAWEVMWIDYDPVAYSKQKYDFPKNLQSFVDEDILLLQELSMDEVRNKLPAIKWNSSSVNAAGITIDRTSWCTNEDGEQLIYKLDQGIPRNPFGRTGLKGKAALPRWGPNHYVMLIITRFNPSRGGYGSSSHPGGKYLEFVAEKNFPRWDQYTIPGKFVAGEHHFLDLQSLFKTDNTSNWISSNEMIEFFKSALIRNTSGGGGDDPTVSPPTPVPSNAPPSLETGLKHEKVIRGYMDDPFNTDNAWKELELWHFHFSVPENLSDKFHPTYTQWKVISEDVFVKLPPGQSALLYEITKKLQPTII